MLKSYTIILDLTDDCMMRCKYCYIEGGKHKNYMTREIALNSIQKFASLCNDGIINILFHGGEPLLAIYLIKDIVNYTKVRKYDNIRFFIQTNGININEEIAVFLKESNIKTCVSIDGVTIHSNMLRIIHNQYNHHFSYLCLEDLFIIRILNYFFRHNIIMTKLKCDVYIYEKKYNTNIKICDYIEKKQGFISAQDIYFNS